MKWEIIMIIQIWTKYNCIVLNYLTLKIYKYINHSGKMRAKPNKRHAGTQGQTGDSRQMD